MLLAPGTASRICILFRILEYTQKASKNGLGVIGITAPYDIIFIIQFPGDKEFNMELKMKTINSLAQFL